MATSGIDVILITVEGYPREILANISEIQIADQRFYQTRIERSRTRTEFNKIRNNINPYRILKKIKIRLNTARVR